MSNDVADRPGQADIIEIPAVLVTNGDNGTAITGGLITNPVRIPVQIVPTTSRCGTPAQTSRDGPAPQRGEPG
jgi:hypothetical protein